MCLVALAIDRSRRFPLVIASNRDEYFNRPAARLAWWTPSRSDLPVLSGRDLDSGGTWLGLTAQGRLALLTNVRGAAPHDPLAPSRGSIAVDWLSARESTGNFWMRTAMSGHNGFNLLAADFVRSEFFWASNAQSHPHRHEFRRHDLARRGGGEWNAEQLSSGANPLCRQLHFDGARGGRHRSGARTFAEQALAHVGGQFVKGIGNSQLFHRVRCLRIRTQRL